MFGGVCPVFCCMCVQHQYLSYPMGSIHGLQVPHGVPVMFHKHHGVCTSQVQTQTTNMCGQQQHINRWVIVKPETEEKQEEVSESVWFSC